MDASAAIEVKSLCKSYRQGLRLKSLRALHDVSLRVNRGEVFGLLGPNGAGKTTLIKILLGIARPTSGSAELLGCPAGDQLSRLRVGYLPENLRIPPHHSAVSAMNYYGRLSRLSLKQISARRDLLLDRVGLTGRTNESVRRFSKGMLQRLGLAQALLHDPELLILDEPTDGLDPVGRTQVRLLLREFADQGKTVFLNSHILQEVELVCDRVAILDKGILKGVGTAEQIAPQRRVGIELEIVIEGPSESVRKAIGERQFLSSDELPANRHRVRIHLADQQHVDRFVDDLRHASLSIISLNPRRVTLEDAFIELLNTNEVEEGMVPIELVGEN